jgi:hypothetical protein
VAPVTAGTEAPAIPAVVAIIAAAGARHNYYDTRFERVGM